MDDCPNCGCNQSRVLRETTSQTVHRCEACGHRYTQRRDWSEVPTVAEARERSAQPTLVYDLPRCPECDGARIRAVRTSKQGDGSKLNHMHCQQCGHRFRVVWQ